MVLSSNMPQSSLAKFLSAMETVYGPLCSMSDTDTTNWLPPPAKGAHKGRSLWTDAIGVLNFITLHSTTSDSNAKYLTLATRLVAAVHETNGRTRDGSARLPGASESEPLRGGLHSGEVGDEGALDGGGDGQYHHHLVLWMFALNRLSLAARDLSYNQSAISLARAIHPAFVVNRSSESHRPRLYAKVSVDLSRPLSSNEDSHGLDAVGGYVVFKLLQRVAGDDSVLQEEIADYQKLLVTQIPRTASNDPFDLGMALWAAHWFSGEEEWATKLSESASHYLRKLSTVDDYFDLPLHYRIAFHDFGAVLGIRCLNQCNLNRRENSVSPPLPSANSSTRLRRDSQMHVDFCALARKTVSAWESVGVVPSPSEHASINENLVPITCMMYAASLWPGAFKNDQFNTATT